MAGCSGSPDTADDAAPAQASADAGAPAITPEYLGGEWCYLRFEAGNEVSEENITYNFAADGTLKYQTNSSTPVDQDGSYEFKDGVLKVSPALAMFKLKPEQLGDGEMTFSAMGGKFVWSRGACPAA